MRKGITSAALALLVITVPIGAKNYPEPKDSFLLFGWMLYSAPTPVVHLDSKPKKVAPAPVPKPVTQHKIIHRVITKPTVTVKPTAIRRPVISSSGYWYTAKASEYGGSDGFWYGHFACGGKYYPSVVGVAHKTLPCGTLVTFKYNGHIANIRVVDRGPYCCGRSWDFTTAAARLLHFNGIGTVYWKLAK